MGCMVVIGKRGLGEQSELEFGDRGIRFAGTETWGEAERARLTQQRSVRALPLLDVTPWTGELCGPRREQPRRWLTGLRPLPEDLKPETFSGSTVGAIPPPLFVSGEEGAGAHATEALGLLEG